MQVQQAKAQKVARAASGQLQLDIQGVEDSKFTRPIGTATSLFSSGLLMTWESRHEMGG
jgi:hypothetical protein